MKRFQIITTISLLTLIVLSAYFVYFNESDYIPFKEDAVIKNNVPEVKQKDTEVIMGIMGNRTEK